MATKSQKEKAKAYHEKGQAILSRLLKDDDNKYCVDCDAKGPRWASWNLGIFLCIRCAGIHRNLGAHVSKVKSVNLDTWTPEQISMMMEIGNSRARAVYEANIPDGFCRPQSNSSLEAFIRSKYEQKKYIAREWIPPIPRVPREFLEDDTKDKKKIKKTTSSMIQLNTQGHIAKPTAPITNGEIKPSGSAPSKLSDMDKAEAKPASSSIDDLLGLDMPEKQPDSQSTANFLGEIINQPAPISATATPTTSPPTEADQVKTNEEPVFDDPVQTKSTKDSIMALYGSGGASASQQPYGAFMGMHPMGVNQYSQMNINPAQMGMNPLQMNANVAQTNMNAIQMNMNPRQMNMSPGQMNMSPGQMNMSSAQMGMMNTSPMSMYQVTGGQVNQPSQMMPNPQSQMMPNPQSQMMPNPQTQMMPNPQSQMMPHPQPQMMSAVPQQQSTNFMPIQPMYGGGGGNVVYNNVPMQQYQYNQMQQQMAGLSLGGVGVPGQMGQVTTQSWQPASSTLSNNLWQ